MGARILVINNNAELEAVLRNNLDVENVQIVPIDVEADVDSELERVSPDLILFNEPVAEYLGIGRRLRVRCDTKTTPILLLSSDKSDPLISGSSRARGVWEADDHFIKPFSVPELIARIHALLLRTRPNCLAGVLNIGDIELDRDTMCVRRAARPIKLLLNEYRLLELLMGQVGRVFTRQQLIGGLGRHGAHIDDRTVDVYIGRLRAALNRRGDRDPLRTVRGAGYAFDDRYTATPVLLRTRRFRLGGSEKKCRRR